jgi:hypothetical protein
VKLVWSLCLLVTIGLLGSGQACAETVTYVIAIGNNAPPPGQTAEDEGLRALRYADDDAAAFFTFTRPLSRRASLLTVLDRDSQRRFPELVAQSRPPSLAELRRVVAEYRTSFEADRRAGDEPVLLFFYSGHGSSPPDQAPSLTLLDAPLTQQVLYDDVLASLPTRYTHVLVDACHAEAVVRPRDADAEPVAVAEDDARRFAARTTLSRFPQVGALVATTSVAQAHEWDVYQRGVFTHELLSGLRGGADVNHDGRIEYSELDAFLAAANHGIVDPRARLRVVAHPPDLNRRAPIVDLTRWHGDAQLVGAAAQLGWFHVEDARGNRIADVRTEPDFKIALHVPAGATLFIINGAGEAEITPSTGARIDLQHVRLHPPALARRGALDLAMQRGLFAAPFGPTYYRGYVDQSQELVAVSFTDESASSVDLSPSPPTRPSRRPAWLSFGVAAGLAVTSGVFAGLAARARQDYDGTELQRTATDARTRFNAYEGVAIGAAVATGAVALVGALLFVRASHDVRVAPDRQLPAGTVGTSF